LAIDPVTYSDLQLLIFDLDGVITSEEKYWNTARLTAWELLCQPQALGLANYFGAQLAAPAAVLAAGEAVISTDFITELKNRAVNSNWDLTFFVFSLQLIGVLKQLPPEDLEVLCTSGVQLEEGLAEYLQTIGHIALNYPIDPFISQQIIQEFWKESAELRGTAVQDYVPLFAQQILGQDLGIFRSHSALWQLCYQNFQAWYEGDKGYVLPEDATVLPVAEIRSVLAALAGKYKLAIATGRPRNETIPPLTTMGLIEYFDPARIVTYDEVLVAEKLVDIKLGKPHPFIVLKAIYPEAMDLDLLQPVFSLHPQVAYIGDAASDVAAALAAGCGSIGVLTGFGKDLEYKRRLLSGMGCDRIIPSVLDLPDLLGRT
jgi:phosphoglycolate phosphatase-like HAD superfamily hydrolase